IEYEVVRDAFDNCITVCNMENVDPLGIHTGESVVVAPSQTLTDKEYNMLRTCAIKVIRHFGIIGECNIQYALDPSSDTYYIIEVNARLSRSSALASKATGYPLAYVAAKLALGQRLPVIRNSVTGVTTACFEPSLDYCVVKIPRWDLGKFARVSQQIGSSMKSVGEVMGIGRSFEEAFQKALRMVNEHADGFSPDVFPRKPTMEDLSKPTDKRMFAIARGMYFGDFTVDDVATLTQIDKWFVHRMSNIVDIYHKLEKETLASICAQLLLEAKQAGFSDKQIAAKVESTESMVREKRLRLNMKPCVKQIDTVSGEWPAQTNYLYVTYNGTENDVQFNMKNAVIVLGSGVYRIGSSVEFDASCVGCMSTDYDMCDRLYFEEISFETVIDIYHMEKPKGVVLAFGGQAANNIALSLSKAHVNIFGTSPNDIDSAEDRFKFSRKLESLQISQPMWKRSDNVEDAKQFCAKVGYPCLIRPSYVLSGAAMNVAHNEDDLAAFLRQATVVAKEHPVVVSKFISEAKEIDVDAVAMDGEVLVMAVSEHVESAGIHSGDATLVTPPQDLNQVTLDRIQDITHRIASAFNANGPFNVQLIAKDNELRVIECNLRVSRSFPFVSKTLDFDFVALATRAMMAVDNPAIGSSLKKHSLLRGKGRVGVKVPQFSFSRLTGADVMLGVEMASTGEVACFGKDRREAYLKALLSTGFILPKRNIFLSIGGYHAKSEMLRSVQVLQNMGFELYGSKGTADYFQSNNIHVTAVDWPFEEGSSDEKTASWDQYFSVRSVAEFFENKEFHLVINLPIRGSGAYRVSAYRTHGYKTRRMAIDNGIPLITDIKCAKLFIEALRTVGRRPPVNSQIDCVASRILKRLPGLIDVHVHVRDPGATHKENWYTCTRAALAGGITQILAMPNTNPPLINKDSYQMTQKLASEQAVVDYALYVGATPQNAQIAAELAPVAAGLKMYLNQTFSTLKMDSVSDWMKHFESFPTSRPIVCHAEKQTLAAVLCVAQMTGRAVHICHVSNAEEIQLVRDAKRKGWPVTCEVCPHHLFLTAEDLPAGIREVRPPLATDEDKNALWNNLEYIDCFATDHAPHTWAEKNSSGQVPPGFPGIEYMVPLLLTAVSQGKLTMRQLVDRLHYNPKRIFGLPDQSETYIEVDLNEEWEIPKTGGESKAGWTPYAGRKVRGRISKVVVRGEEAYVDGEIHVSRGFGKNVRMVKLHEVQKVVSGTSSNELMNVDTNLIQQMQAIPEEPQESTKSISGEGSPVLPIPRFSHRVETLAGSHLLSVHELSKTAINCVFDVADRFRSDVERRHVLTHILEGYVMASLFYEVSTRTSCSFSAAMQRLGGGVISMDSHSSSVQKGESLEDSVTVMANYADVVVLRHKDTGAAARAAAVSSRPLINAGDGTGLLDVYTIRQEIGTVNGLTIAMVGDLKHGRTVHSLAKLLCFYKNITLHYVSPTLELGMPESVTDYVDKKAGFTQKIFTSLQEGIQNVDVVYMTRIQKERFASIEEYNKIKGSYTLTAKLLNSAARPKDFSGSVLGPSRNLPIIMHPLPRVDEISTELDRDDRAAYFRQAENGMYVRMAILTMILGKSPLPTSV
ncbi:Orotidine 5'-phosphate decarboxylase, partial [Parelaphostrongylus tenuis]